MKQRTATIKRTTSETDISLQFNLDGDGQSKIDTGIAFLDHMLDLFSKHGLFDISLAVKGDLAVDYHHSVEDVGICLGQAVHKALDGGKQINRYASGLIPMDEALCQIAIDISNRPHLSLSPALPKGKVGTFDTELIQEFFQAFVSNARVSLHITMLAGENLHHIIEAAFKAFGVILDQATQRDPRKKGVPSTKGVL